MDEVVIQDSPVIRQKGGKVVVEGEIRHRGLSRSDCLALTRYPKVPQMA
jgi:hypothetical protein